MESLIIREAEMKDTDSIAEFNTLMALETEDKKLNRDTISMGVKNLVQKPEYGFYLVAELEGKIIASLMITYEWSDWRNGLIWWIQSVYVKKEFRRMGIYRAMYIRVKEMAMFDKNIRGFRLYVEKENETAMKTYKSLGMSESDYIVFEELKKK